MNVVKAASMSKAASCALALPPMPDASAAAAYAAVPSIALREMSIFDLPAAIIPLAQPAGHYAAASLRRKA